MYNPVGYISQTPEEEKLKPIPKPRTRFQKKQRKHTPRSSDESSSSSSCEEDYTLVRQESILCKCHSPNVLKSYVCCQMPLFLLKLYPLDQW
jgi:hypothetical protein